MTALDRAFIKAYSHKWRAADAPTQPGDEPALSSVSHPRPIEKPQREIPEPQVFAHAADQRPIDVSRKAIYQFDGPQYVGAANLVSAAPMSEYVAKPPSQPAPILADEQTAELRARFEVDALAWPDVCQQLEGRISVELDRLAQGILHHARSGQKLVVITGIHRSEGRTTMALLLAKALAAVCSNVALMDADFVNPTLGSQLGLAIEVGWEHVLGGETELPDVLIRSIADRLTVIPLSAAATRMASKASRLRTSVVTRMVREHFDLVVLDAGPLGAHGELGAPLGSLDSIAADAVYWIYDRRRTSLEDVVQSTHQIADAGLTVGGIIENFGGTARREQLVARAVCSHLSR